jgi:hypothetical protein
MRSNAETESPSPTTRLTIALVVSACLHLVLFWFISAPPSPKSVEEKLAAPPQLATRTPRAPQTPPEKFEPPPKPKPCHIPMIFVETDNSQPTGAPPEGTKFYGKHSTVAANPKPDPAKHGDTPRIEGSQDKVPSVTDVPVASARPSPPPLPEIKAAQPNAAIPESAAAPKENVKTDAAPQERPRLAEKPNLTNGQILIPEVIAPRAETEPSKPEEKSKPNARPQQQTAAIQQSPQPPSPAIPAPSLQRQIPAHAAKMDESSAAQRGNVSLNVKGTPFGVYDEKLVAAVSRRWHLLLQDKFFFDRRGSVVIEFLLKEDGSVENARIVEESVGVVLAAACLSAIVDCAPYDPFTKEMRELLGGKPRELRFTFFY